MHPALTHWANFCRASGASWRLRTGWRIFGQWPATSDQEAREKRIPVSELSATSDQEATAVALRKDRSE